MRTLGLSLAPEQIFCCFGTVLDAAEATTDPSLDGHVVEVFLLMTTFVCSCLVTYHVTSTLNTHPLGVLTL